LRGGVRQSNLVHSYDDIISVENLLAAWTEFRRGKRNRTDVLEFESQFMTNILELHHQLHNKIYTHGGYEHFTVSDPKHRDIHKACVRDRLLHHAIYRILYPNYDRRFITDSYSCRNGKGTYKAIDTFHRFARKASRNHTRSCYVLKCDIRKFFASIDQEILQKIIGKEISCSGINGLLKKVIESFHSNKPRKGLPLGNLTSQLLVNIYMNEFDQYVTHKLKFRHYIRYADDFVFLSGNKDELLKILAHIVKWLDSELLLELHPNKVSVQTVSSGVDFLGWSQFKYHKVLRNVTKRRVVLRFQNPDVSEASKQSYLGLLRHGDTYKLLRSLNKKI
jgi:RNA-directed DNA polymerase